MRTRRASSSSVVRRNSRSAMPRFANTSQVWNSRPGGWKTKLSSCPAMRANRAGAAPVLALLQSLKRRTDVERILEAIRNKQEGAPDSTDRRLLLADGAFATASLSGAVGRQAALDEPAVGSKRRTDDAERLELLGLALDGPRAGPIGEAIVTRLARWGGPGPPSGKQTCTPSLARGARRRSLRRRCNSHSWGTGTSWPPQRVSPRSSGGARGGGSADRPRPRVVNPWVTAAALDALSRGWPSTDGLDDWLHEAEQSPSVQLRAVAGLALYRRGRRGNETRDSLLRALSTRWSRFTGGLHAEIMDALVADWADDANCTTPVGSACTSVVHRNTTSTT